MAGPLGTLGIHLSSATKRWRNESPGPAKQRVCGTEQKAKSASHFGDQQSGQTLNHSETSRTVPTSIARTRSLYFQDLKVTQKPPRVRAHQAHRLALCCRRRNLVNTLLPKKTRGCEKSGAHKHASTHRAGTHDAACLIPLSESRQASLTCSVAIFSIWKCRFNCSASWKDHCDLKPLRTLSRSAEPFPFI